MTGARGTFPGGPSALEGNVPANEILVGPQSVNSSDPLCLTELINAAVKKYVPRADNVPSTASEGGRYRR